MVFSEGKWITFEESMNLHEEDLKEYDTINDRISRITDEEIAEQDTVPLSDWTRDNITNPRIIEYFNNMGMVQTTLFVLCRRLLCRQGWRYGISQ